MRKRNVRNMTCHIYIACVTGHLVTCVTMQPQNPNYVNTRVTSRAWLYTIFTVGNNFEPDLTSLSRVTAWFDQLESCVTQGKIKYAIGQLERCPNSGRLHIQLYVFYPQPVRLGRLKSLLNLPVGYGWAQPRRGSHQQAVDYCSKEDTRTLGPYEYGRVSDNQGKRSDIDCGVEALKAGGLKRVAEESPSLLVKYPRGFDKLAQYICKPSNAFIKKEVHVLFGEPETGKTKWAYLNYPGLFRMPTPSYSSYWAGDYQGQEEVLLDDYGNSPQETYPWSFFLQVLDGGGIVFDLPAEDCNAGLDFIGLDHFDNLSFNISIVSTEPRMMNIPGSALMM